jgi:predicted RNA-binding Zn ribbon-like protein
MARYPFRRGPLALELASTIFAVDGQVRDGLAAPADLAAWLGVNHLYVPRAVAVSHLDTFRALRNAVRELIGAVVEGYPPAPSAVARLNDLSAAAPQWTRLDWADQTPGRTSVEVADDPLALALAIVARSCIDMLTSPMRGQLRLCRAPGCVLYFLKERGRREWCSAQCGNRARVARHYRRHHVRALQT